ncbi:MAG: hypothetical protein DHS20C14_18420 [Phycisphaeraceae bacterium]|nr:MAG: hypothetical protein DHS20C14_18420 [Phycisphaeraceae bacterium]
MPRRLPIQSMFRRRLVLIGASMVLACGAIGAQLTRLTVIEGAEHRDRAESRLVRERWTPTVRGRILDRKGRVLAADRAGYTVELDYDALTGDWARTHGRTLAYRANKDTWRGMSPKERDAAAGPFVAACEAHLDESRDRLCVLLGIERADLDERAAAVVGRVRSMKAAVVERATARLRADLESRGVPIDAEAEARIASVASRPIAEEKASHPIATGVPDAVGFDLVRLSSARALLRVPGADGAGAAVDVLPGVQVRNAAERIYPHDALTVEVDTSTLPRPLAGDGVQPVQVADIAASIIGRVRTRVYAQDIEDRAAAVETDDTLRARAIAGVGTDRGQYQSGDTVGHTGVERALETTLRGLRGVHVEHLATGDVTDVPADAGRDVQLTIDVALQARVRAAMDPALGLAQVHEWHQNGTLEPGTNLYGAAVVMEIDTGEILAMVSTPTAPRDGDWTRYGLSSPEQVELFGELFSPDLNKAIAKPYPPGSIAKAMILAGAIERGQYILGERIAATGHLLPDNDQAYRSWIFKSFGITHFDQLGRDPDAVDALMVSANVFFYTLGRRLGPERLADLYADYGVSSAFDLGLGAEWPGRVGALDGPGDGTDLGTPDAILMGIGQGPVTWTPVHAASAYATIARAGVFIEPKLVRDGRAPKVVRDLALDDDTYAAILDGLSEAVNNPEFGTGCALRYELGGAQEPIFRVPGIRVRGKTGTATAPAIVIDPDDDGPAPPVVAMSGDHSWFVVLVGEEGDTPRYAISVVMDYAGSGGRVSGPICDQIVRALVAEGYLNPVPSADPGGGES